MKKLFTRAILILILIDFIYVWVLWFRHNINIQGKVPVSSFMQSYIDQKTSNPKQPKLRWSPVPLSSIPYKVSRVFLIAEDTHFYSHHGFDTGAIKSVVKDSLSKKSISRGASTISQQTAKNLYLYPKRSWLRKWHEVVFTLLLESTQSKKRILELYLNIAEFGQGIYGINAASLYYFGIPASAIAPQQAAYLAAALPWPRRHNFKSRTKSFNAHANTIYKRSRTERLSSE